MRSEKFNKNIENKQKFSKKEEKPAFKVETIEEKIDQEAVFQKIKNQLGEDLLLPIKKELENPQITEEAVNLENKKIEILKNEIESLNKEIETAIENDLSQIAFSNNQEKSKFIKQITQKLRELTPKIPKKKIVYAATSSIMIFSLLQNAGPKLKEEIPQHLEPQDLESLILEDLSQEKLDIENAESSSDLEQNEDETFFYSPNTFTDNYFEIKPPVSTTPSLATTTPTPVFTPTPEISEKSIENQEIKLETIASAQYTNKEYFESTMVNLDLAVKYLNEYFEKNSLKPTDSQEFSFSYNEVMKYFEPEAGWQQTTGLIGSGACDIATLMYRTIKDFSSKIGSDLIKIDRDNVGHDIEQNELFTVRKTNHRPYPGMPEDEISVFVVSKTNRWNSDFGIKINSQFSNGKEVPDDLEIKFSIFKDEQGNYIAQILSNYSLEELQELAK